MLAALFSYIVSLLGNSTPEVQKALIGILQYLVNHVW